MAVVWSAMHVSGGKVRAGLLKPCPHMHVLDGKVRAGPLKPCPHMHVPWHSLANDHPQRTALCSADFQASRSLMCAAKGFVGILSARQELAGKWAARRSVGKMKWKTRNRGHYAALNTLHDDLNRPEASGPSFFRTIVLGGH